MVICSHAERFQIGFHDSPVENSPFKKGEIVYGFYVCFYSTGKPNETKIYYSLIPNKNIQRSQKKKKKKTRKLASLDFHYFLELSSGKITCCMKLANILKPVITDAGCSILSRPHNTYCCAEGWLQSSSSSPKIFLDLCPIKGTAPAHEWPWNILLLLASLLNPPQYQAGLPPVCRLWAE